MATLRSPFLASAIFSLTISFSALAQSNPCKAYLATTPQKLVIQPDQGVKPPWVEERRKLIGQVNAMIAPDLKIPKSVTIILAPKGMDAYHVSHFPDGHEIHVPYQFELKTATKHPVHSAAILAHEYGHGILAENLMLNETFQSALAPLGKFAFGGHGFADYLRWERLRTEIDHLAARNDVLVKARAERAKVTSDPNDPELKAIDAELAQIDARGKEIEVEFEKVAPAGEATFELLAGYHEFFADVVAVVFYNDPKVIWRGLYSPKLEYVGMSQQEEHEIFKSFTLRRFDKNVRVRNFSEEEAHVELTPVRSYLWKHYLSNPLYRTHRSKMLRAVYDSIVDEVMERAKTPNITPSPAVQNQRLIQRLDANFAKLKESITNELKQTQK